MTFAKRKSISQKERLLSKGMATHLKQWLSIAKCLPRNRMAFSKANLLIERNLLVIANSFTESHFFWWKPFHLLEDFASSGSHSISC